MSEKKKIVSEAYYLRVHPNRFKRTRADGSKEMGETT